MKTKFLLCLGLIIAAMATQLSEAQTTITSVSYLIVGTGAVLIATQNMNVVNGGNLLVNGTLTLKKDLVNQTTVQDDLGPGTVRFAGTEIQNLTGQNVFQNVTTDTYGLILGGSRAHPS
jgi:hypothetical protein